MMRRTALLLVALACGTAGAHAQPAWPDPEALVALLRAGDYPELDARVGAYQAAYEANTDAEWPLLELGCRAAPEEGGESVGAAAAESSESAVE